MKQLSTLRGMALIIAALLISCGDVENAEIDEIIPQTQSQAASSKTFSVKRCINLGNALEAEEEGAWGYTIEAKHIALISTAGFDTIRLPVRWDLMTESQVPYRINSARMARVKEVVHQAQAEGLGVIIDVHHYEPLFENIEAQLPRLIAIWEQIATAFKNAPDTVYFEPLNEPFPRGTAEDVNRAYRAVIPVIRKTNPNRTLILGGHQWSNETTLKDIDLPKDPNIVATFHDYEPHEFTHQGNQWGENPPPMGRKWGSKKDQAEFAKVYRITQEFQKEARVPLFVGEFGVIQEVPLAERNEWMFERRKKMETLGYGWCVWDFSGAFSLYDTSQERWKPGVLNALMK